MGFQALLFCPDEKTARSVTQVLGELEFNVEPCNEPFAAVKQLMGTHFDAIVVDCDNEQNAALLFKSARTSTSNQSSLAVAVVEGQTGVAKAFRIGANLVLTKPINIEQAKGTLRVARGLLRKSDPAKPATPAAPAAAPPAPSAAPAPAAAPVKTAGSLPVAPAARPAPKPAAKPAPSPAQAAVASSASVAAAAAKKTLAPVLPAAKPTIGAARAVPVAPSKLSATAPSASLSSGAASAPAPAREILEIPPAEVKPATAPSEDDNILEAPGAEKPKASTGPAKDAAQPAPTLGGAKAPTASAGAKKIVWGVAAAVVVAAGSYAGWMYHQGRMGHSISNAAPANIAAPSAPSTQPAAAASLAATSNVQPAAHPAVAVTRRSTAAENENNEAAPDETASSAASNSTKPSKTELVARPGGAPLVVKGGTAPTKNAAAEADAAAPSLIGIATPASSGPLPNLGPTATPKPVLQRLHISQGVSTGLLIKKIDPVYPETAQRLRIEGAVQLLATISKDGDITQVKVVSGDHQLSRAAVDAVKRWKYQPYLLNGEPVEIETQITINFKLPR
jgi:protein TonB